MESGQGAKAKVHRLGVQLARNGRGVHGRRYTHVAASSPSLDEARRWLESPAEEGGMSVKILPDDLEVRKVLACLACGSEQGGHCSERLVGHIAHFSKRDHKESLAQAFGAPSEVFIVAVDPLYFAVRDSTPHGLEFDKAECTKLTQAMTRC